MNIVLVIGGVWLGLLIVAVVACSRIGRRLNPHVSPPEESEETDAEQPGSGPDPDSGPGHPTR